MEIKPTFVFTKILLESTAWFLSVVGIAAFFDLISGNSALIKEFYLIWALIFILIVAGYMVWKKLTYRATVYSFQAQHMEYSESFIHIEQKELQYDRIVEVALSRSIFDRMFGLGKIILHTHATASTHSASGIKMIDVANSQDVYQRIKQTVRNPA